MKIEIILTGFILLTSTMHGQESFSAMTYNIRLGSVDDGPNHWDIRKEHVRDLMAYYHPSFFGLQEAQKFQLEYLTAGLKGYAVSGKPRTLDENAEYSCILFDTMAFRLMKENTIWLSPTPETISIGWDASLPRIASYSLFEHKVSKDKIWIMSTHFDHKGTTARLESSKLLLNKTKELYKENAVPVVVMGDFNARPEEESIQLLSSELAESRSQCLTKAYGGPDTWNGFLFDQKPDGQIDYLFLYDIKAQLRISKHRTITDSYDTKYPSDHLPVLVEFSRFVTDRKTKNIW
ncbi:MAG: endonuclease/exonuclease/phosphatase family protein [Saprospiraceae bacterium]|nr:endonuclease/exonuclease/phosphatase family protein [Saprospiraceae bacterium]